MSAPDQKSIFDRNAHATFRADQIKNLFRRRAAADIAPAQLGADWRILC
jgi:hypothetical protein